MVLDRRKKARLTQILDKKFIERQPLNRFFGSALTR